MVALITNGRGRRGNTLVTTVTGVIVSTLLLLLAGSSSGGVSAANPYSSNVVALTSANWKEVVLDNPHAVLINICRNG